MPFLATDESAPANLRFEYVPLVHFGGDILQVWGSIVGGKKWFRFNWVVGWHVSAVSWRHGSPFGKGGATASFIPAPRCAD